MKIKDIRELTTPELRARLKDEKDKLVRMQLNHAVSAIERPSDLRQSRKNIARLLTVLRERELEDQQ
jgi:large subunit ribosomal protein L29